MKKNKDVIDLLLDLPAEKRNRFVAFLESPFFGYNKQCAGLVKLVDITNPKCSQFYSLPFLAKKLKRSEGTILNQLTQLKKAHREFVVHAQVQEDNTLKDRLYLEKLDYENQFLLLPNELDLFNTWILENESNLSYRDKIAAEKKKLYLTERISKGTDNSGEVENILRIFNFDTELFLLEYFYLLAELEFRGQETIHPALASALIAHSDAENKDGKFRLSRLFVLAYILRNKATEDAYLKLNTYFTSNIHLVDLIDQEKIITVLYNYCLKRINQGFYEEEAELYKLFQFANQQEFLLTTLNPALLKNAVKAGLSQKALTWSENLLNESQEALPFEIYNTAFVYCDALISFYKKDFSESVRSLSLALKQRVIEKIQFSILRLKCFFHLEDFDGLYNECKKLTNLSISLSKDKQTSVMDFKKMVLDIYKSKLNKKALETFEVQLEDNKIVERKWLLEIINPGK